MHVVFFSDQHLESFGGAQVSMRLQRQYLEKAGHTVTVVAPRMHGSAGSDAAYVDLPSMPITFDREYSLTWPGERTDAWVDAAFDKRPPVDLVHVQADFWGAFIGHRFARRHTLPLVHTMHNRVDIGIEATMPFPSLVLRGLNAWERRVLGTFGDTRRRASGVDGWAYLRRLARDADAVTAPSAHFARRLERHGVVPQGRRGLPLDEHRSDRRVDVIWNGMDDDALESLSASAPGERAPGRARFAWLGRMSPEKRLLPFLDALAVSGVDADVQVFGGGSQLRAARRLVEKRGLAASVRFMGRMPHADVLRLVRRADAVVQTSIGFETQGMTPFEAASLGTPSIVSDPDIAAELGSGFWAVGGGRDAAPAHADDSVAALAQTLREAVADIESGVAPAVNPAVREQFRQSSRTAAMLDVYARVLA